MLPASEAILIALLLVLVLVVAYQGYKTSKDKKDGFHPDASQGGCGGGAPDPSAKAVPHEAQKSLADAQREAWYQMTANGGNGSFDPGTAGAPGDELAQFHAPAPGINYQDALVDSVADPRMRAQHKNWYADVGPKSQTAMAVDSMDEAATMSLPRQGITAFRLRAPSQHNPMFVTEQDKSQFDRQATNFFIG